MARRVRLRRPIGQGVSIVGALVIGQAAVSAGLTGSLMVMVVALIGVATFAVPAQIDAGIVLRAAYTVRAGAFGVYGVVLGLVVTVAPVWPDHLRSVPFAVEVSSRVIRAGLL